MTNRQGTGFTNLQKILAANRSNRLGSTISSGISQVAVGAKRGIGEAEDKFKDQLETTQETLAQKKAAGESAVKKATETGNLSESDINQYKDFQNAAYTGPRGLENDAKLRSSARDAQELGDAAGSKGGRLDLLKRFATQPGGGSYTNRKQALDEILLSQTGEEHLQKAKKDTRGIQETANRTSNIAQQTASSAEAANINAQKQIAGNVQNTLSGTQGLLTKLNTDLKTALEKKAAAFGSLTSGVNVTDADYQAKLNALTGPERQYDPRFLFGANAFDQRFFNVAADPTISNIATPEERAKVLALEQLLGKSDFSIQQDAAAYDPSQDHQFNRQLFGTEIENKRQEYQARITPFKNDMDEAQRQLAHVAELRRVPHNLAGPWNPEALKQAEIDAQTRYNNALQQIKSIRTSLGMGG